MQHAHTTFSRAHTHTHTHTPPTHTHTHTQTRERLLVPKRPEPGFHFERLDLLSNVPTRQWTRYRYSAGRFNTRADERLAKVAWVLKSFPAGRQDFGWQSTADFGGLESKWSTWLGGIQTHFLPSLAWRVNHETISYTAVSACKVCLIQSSQNCWPIQLIYKTSQTVAWLMRLNNTYSFKTLWQII